MAGYRADVDRNIVPRWRQFEDSLRLGELDSASAEVNHLFVTRDFLRQKIADWKDNQTLGHASDAVGAAITLKRESEVREPARFILRTIRSEQPLVAELAERALEDPPTTGQIVSLAPKPTKRSTLQTQIRTHREILRNEPRDAIGWVELSRLYITLGLSEQANNAMDVAVHLARNNRFVVRAASRLWVHTGQKDKAYDTIARAESTAHDPWLLAAQLAVGNLARRKVRRIGSARRMLTDEQLSPAHVSELASAVGTLELGAGRRKQARRLFKQSLIDPTENSVAQAVWAGRKYGALSSAWLDSRLSTAFEAESWTHYENANWAKAVERCRLWQFDQPFSTGPGWHGTFTAAVAMQDYESSMWFAENGLAANPNDFILANNLVFALINRGELELAGTRLQRIEKRSLTVLDRSVLKATRGLFEYRSGRLERGRQLYLDAREIAQRHKAKNLLALATAFHAIEETAIAADGHDQLRSTAVGLLKQQKQEPAFRVLEARLANLVPGRRFVVDA